MTRRTCSLVHGVACALALSIAGCGDKTPPKEAPRPAQSAPVEAADPSADFLQMAERHAGQFLVTAPEIATSLGLGENVAGAGFLSRLGGYGFSAHQEAREMNERFLQELRAYDRDALSPDARLTYDILRNAYETGARRNGFDFGGATPFGGEIPNGGNGWAITPYLVTQLTGPHLNLPFHLQNEHPLTTAAEVDAYLNRLGEFPRTFREITETVGSDAAIGIMPPRFVVNGAINAIDGLIAPAPADHPLVTRLTEKMDEIGELGEADRNEKTARAVDLIENAVYPAYGRLKELLQTIAAQTNDDAGVWRLGDEGEAFYDFALAAYGAGEMDGEAVHNLGLAEVEHITGEMDAILKGLGLKDGAVSDRMQTIAARDGAVYPNTDEGREALLQSLRDQVATIDEIAPDWFGRLPKTPVEVRRIAVHEQDTSPGGYYTSPSLDGSRPGVYWINLKDTADNPKHSLPTLTYHEAVPGHHFQIALQLEAEDTPLMRKMLSYSEYVEGWALYGEKLAKEMGMYDDDPEGDLGRLQAELFRAARLVVDSGLHHKRWTRDEAIDYMVGATGETRASVTREVERYAAVPGQACSYKLGMIRIEALRAEAEVALGEAFDIRAFHDMVLAVGPTPLEVLEARVKEWVGERKA